MKITSIETQSHEQLVRVEDQASGLLGFIAVHSTKLGPAAGGLRMRPYDSEAAAIEDALRLSRGMTYKNAAAGLPLGGGKAVIMGTPATDKNPALLQAFGQAVESLRGAYWTAEDMGMTPADMAVIASQTRYVAGLKDGDFASGDPSPITARGIFNAIRTAARHKFGSADLTGRSVAVQGLGNVGWNLCALLQDAGARLIVADVAEAQVARAVEAFDARAVSVQAILSEPADIFAPCAIGAILNAGSIPGLQVQIVAGGANNQLATPEDGRALQARGILYAPDFVANGGGIINVATEILQIPNRADWVAGKLQELDRTMDRILTRAASLNLSPADVAETTVDATLHQTAA